MRQLLVRFLFLFLVAFTAGQTLHAIPQCDNKDFKGVYGQLASGEILAVPAPPFNPLIGPLVRVGHVEADGAGNVMVRNTASYSGYIITEPYGGQYTVHSDCTIDFNLIVPLPIIGSPGPILVPVPFQFSGALAANGRDVAVVIESPPGATVRVLLRQQNDNKAACSTRDLSNGYQLDLSGSIVAQSPNPPGPFARDGVVVFDGVGGFSGKTIANYAGAATPEAFSGTYSVDASCNVTMHYTFNSQTYTWLGTLTDKSNGADLIVADPPGAVVAGTLKLE